MSITVIVPCNMQELQRIRKPKILMNRVYAEFRV